MHASVPSNYFAVTAPYYRFNFIYNLISLVNHVILHLNRDIL